MPTAGLTTSALRVVRITRLLSAPGSILRRFVGDRGRAPAAESRLLLGSGPSLLGPLGGVIARPVTPQATLHQVAHVATLTGLPLSVM